MKDLVPYRDRSPAIPDKKPGTAISIERRVTVRYHCRVMFLPEEVVAIQYRGADNKYSSVSEMDLINELEGEMYFLLIYQEILKRNPDATDLYVYLTKRKGTHKVSIHIRVTPVEPQFLARLKDGRVLVLQEVPFIETKDADQPHRLLSLPHP